MAKKRKKSPFVFLHTIALILIAVVIFSVAVLDLREKTSVDVPLKAISMDWNSLGYQIDIPPHVRLIPGQGIADLLIPADKYLNNSLIKEAEIELTSGSKQCDSFGRHISKKETVVINGLEYEKASWSGAAAGNLFRGVDYNLLKDGLCYQVRLYTNTAEPKGVPKTQKEQASKDMQKLMVLADGVVSSLRFTSFK